MKAVFVTGTDTGVGKSLICGLLGRYLSQRGYRVITQKWVQTGSKDSATDIDLHLQLMNRTKRQIKEYLPYVLCYTFKFAASCHLAASLEKRRIKPEKIKESYRFLTERFDFVVVEGLGGALVPLSKRGLIIDIVKELDLPVLIVAANKLGAINHTLLTIEAFKKRRLKIIGIILNNQTKADPIILRDNPRIIKALTDEKIMGVLPQLKDKAFLYRAFVPIGEKILAHLQKR